MRSRYLVGFAVSLLLLLNSSVTYANLWDPFTEQISHTHGSGLLAPQVWIKEYDSTKIVIGFNTQNQTAKHWHVKKASGTGGWQDDNNFDLTNVNSGTYTWSSPPLGVTNYIAVYFHDGYLWSPAGGYNGWVSVQADNSYPHNPVLKTRVVSNTQVDLDMSATVKKNSSTHQFLGYTHYAYDYTSSAWLTTRSDRTQDTEQYTGLSANHQYSFGSYARYRVISTGYEEWYFSGWSTLWTMVSAHTQQNLKLSRLTNSTATLEWSTSAVATTYVQYQATQSPSDWYNVPATSDPNFSTTHSRDFSGSSGANYYVNAGGANNTSTHNITIDGLVEWGGYYGQIYNSPLPATLISTATNPPTRLNNDPWNMSGTLSYTRNDTGYLMWSDNPEEPPLGPGGVVKSQILYNSGEVSTSTSARIGYYHVNNATASGEEVVPAIVVYGTGTGTASVNATNFIYVTNDGSSYYESIGSDTTQRYLNASGTSYSTSVSPSGSPQCATLWAPTTALPRKSLANAPIAEGLSDLSIQLTGSAKARIFLVWMAKSSAPLLGKTASQWPSEISNWVCTNATNSSVYTTRTTVPQFEFGRGDFKGEREVSVQGLPISTVGSHSKRGLAEGSDDPWMVGTDFTGQVAGISTTSVVNWGNYGVIYSIHPSSGTVAPSTIKLYVGFSPTSALASNAYLLHYKAPSLYSYTLWSPALKWDQNVATIKEWTLQSGQDASSATFQWTPTFGIDTGALVLYSVHQ